MNKQELQQQIEAFFNGELSSGEELALRNYLLSHEVPDEMRDDSRIIIATTRPAITRELPEGLEKRMSQFIDTLPGQKARPLIGRSGWRWAVGIAAGIALCVTIGISYPITPSPSLSDEELQACAEARQALLLVSQKLNRGTASWETAQSDLSKVNQIINKQFNHD